MSSPSSTTCPAPACGECKPAHLVVCAACWKETPWELKRALWDAQGKAHLHENKNTLSPYLTPAECAERVRAAVAAIFAHLRLHSSAL